MPIAGMYGVGGHREGDANPDSPLSRKRAFDPPPRVRGSRTMVAIPIVRFDLLDEQAGQEASRFYYCGRASGKERHLGLDGEKIGHPCR